MVNGFSSRMLLQLHQKNSAEHISYFASLPIALTQAISLDYSGVLSDYIILKLLTFHGDKLIKREKVTTPEWTMTYQALQTASSLDPLFWDPYLFAETTLPWDAGMVSETNELLIRAAEARKSDYLPYFFLWFNHYFFLKDPGTSAGYLEKAAQKPGAPIYYSTLSSRMSLYGHDVVSGIIFLQAMLQEIHDPLARQGLLMRLDALKKIDFLEKKLAEYEEKFKKKATHLNDLITSGILSSIPADPYGGSFYIMKKSRRVYTSSELTLK